MGFDPIRVDAASQFLSKALDGHSLRQQAIGHNVANIDTPNFKGSEVTFEDQLQLLLRRESELATVIRITHPAHIDPARTGVSLDGVRPRSIPMLDTVIRNDGNNVDVDREMTRLAETQLMYQALGQLLSHKLQLFRAAVSEGRR